MRCKAIQPAWLVADMLICVLISYGRILSRIESLSPTIKDKARKLIGWVAYSPVPLTVQEIQHALSIKKGDFRGERRVAGALEVGRLCGTIVEVAGDFVQFVHFTAKEYSSPPLLF